MAEVDSWEDQADDVSPGQPAATSPASSASSKFKLSAGAKPFVFNPGASTFQPVVTRPAEDVATSAGFPPQPAQVVASAAGDGGPPGPAAASPAAAPSQDAAVEALGVADEEARADEDSNGDVGGSNAAVDAIAEKLSEATIAEADAPVAPPAPASAGDDADAEGMDDDLKAEVAAVVEEGDEDMREHLNLVFIGHVDAGKSTIGGQILYLTGMVDDRTIQKYEREAKEKNRDSWYMAYIMDTNEEERSKGITVEVGRAHFETAKKRYTILDAPGHKNYVPNMIQGAAQADIGILVISARKGEFETGFERGGQTREHAQLAKTVGVSKLIVVVNKMDEPSVEWEKGRFDEIVTKLTPFLKQCGYNTKKDVLFLPISGIRAVNLKERIPPGMCPWFDGPSLFEALDNLEPLDRDPTAPFRMPVLDKYRDMGTVVMGKIEAGSVRVGDNLSLMPNKSKVKVANVYRDADEVKVCRPGENVRLRLTGVEEEDVTSGFVLSSMDSPCRAVQSLDVQLAILELLEHKAIFTAGYKAVIHIHAAVKECEVVDLLSEIDPKTRKPKKRAPMFVKGGALVTCRIAVPDIVCAEKYSDYPQLGRFTLRDEGKTIAIGKVIGLNE